MPDTQAILVVATRPKLAPCAFVDIEPTNLLQPVDPKI
jgi:hypothetical protein